MKQRIATLVFVLIASAALALVLEAGPFLSAAPPDEAIAELASIGGRALMPESP